MGSNPIRGANKGRKGMFKPGQTRIQVMRNRGEPITGGQMEDLAAHGFSIVDCASYGGRYCVILERSQEDADEQAEGIA